MSIPVIDSNMWSVKVVLRRFEVLSSAFKKTNTGFKWLALWRFLIRTRTEMFCCLIQLSCQTAAYSLRRGHEHFVPRSLQSIFHTITITGHSTQNNHVNKAASLKNRSLNKFWDTKSPFW